MRVHYLQHVPFEGLGSIERWLRRTKAEITRTRFFEAWELPDPNVIDLLIVMGGPMSANDETEYTWLSAEKAFIRDMVVSGNAVLGVCLGAQLIANAMGAAVYPNLVKEIGWLPVQGVQSHTHETFRFPDSTEVFHWHGETFDLPTGAIRLASSQGCTNQAFQLGKSVIGLQFHIETTPASAREIVTHCRAELLPGAYVQSEAKILAAPPRRYHTINSLMENLLDYLTQCKQTIVKPSKPPAGWPV